jgi:hypothetical protein
MSGLVEVENALIPCRRHGIDGGQRLHRVLADFSASWNALHAFVNSSPLGHRA